MGLLQFRKKAGAVPGAGALSAFVQGYSMEVMPRTAEKVADFRALLPAGTRVYIAHLSMAVSKRSGSTRFTAPRPLPTITWAGMSRQ